MTDLILDPTVLHAESRDLWPSQEKGRDAVPASFDLLFGSGHLKLTHAPMEDWVLVTPQLIRIAVPAIVNMEHLHQGLAAGGALRRALVELRCAAISDRGILTACGSVRDELQALLERPSDADTARDEDEPEDPVLTPYDRWVYGIERNVNQTERSKPQVLGLPRSYVNQVKEGNPDLIICNLDDLLKDGLNPVTAKIGIPEHVAGYASARRDWIEIAIKSLVAGIEDAVKRWPVLPGEPFQNFVVIGDDMFVITLDTVDGVTVASPTASKEAQEQFVGDVIKIGRAHLARGLAMLHRAVVS